MSRTISIIECPRDAMQGIQKLISTDNKILYINQLLKVGFDTLDFGSFVSPKAIPQMKDTAEVLKNLDTKDSQTRLLAIIANLRGAKEAVGYDAIHYLGFPLSISETFQIRNTNKTIPQALLALEEIQEVCLAHGKVLIVYISMAFGNPYGDSYDMEIVLEFVNKLQNLKVEIVSLADTIGISDSDHVFNLFQSVISEFDNIKFGAHLHAQADKAEGLIQSAYQAGCRRFDSALKGFGGCPMAKDELVGNIPTESLLSFATNQEIETGLDMNQYSIAYDMVNDIFPAE